MDAEAVHLPLEDVCPELLGDLHNTRQHGVCLKLNLGAESEVPYSSVWRKPSILSLPIVSPSHTIVHLAFESILDREIFTTKGSYGAVPAYLYASINKLHQNHTSGGHFNKEGRDGVLRVRHTSRIYLGVPKNESPVPTCPQEVGSSGMGMMICVLPNAEWQNTDGFNTEYRSRTPECSHAIKHISNSTKPHDAITLLRYESIYHHTIPHNVDQLSRVGLPPFHIQDSWLVCLKELDTPSDHLACFDEDYVSRPAEENEDIANVKAEVAEAEAKRSWRLKRKHPKLRVIYRTTLPICKVPCSIVRGLVLILKLCKYFLNNVLCNSKNKPCTCLSENLHFACHSVDIALLQTCLVNDLDTPELGTQVAQIITLLMP
ncbi:hypothetical protein Acr_07g0017460 [Actinidia rufa]|uniref:Uncharacterized protein n=1 Tax=Actinidia rufa TaxID=165716 RepID=A0A7J0EYR0_9ERIC|nr:hypothetical protein Acr_07g0017460 [Actinidia rufa]